jgi:hypothetical protein
MRALQAIGMGLLVILVVAGRPDLLPDPLGWLLVLHGVRRLPADLPRRRGLGVLAVLALAVSVPVWVPAVADRVLAADPSLQWAVNLPQLLFVVLLATSLGEAAAARGDTAARGWWFLVATLTTLAAAAPVVVFGGGVPALETPAIVLAGAVLLTTIVLCFVHAARPWADAPVPDTAQGRPS